MVHKRDHEFPEFGRAIFPRQHCAGIGELGFPSAWHLPRLDRLRLFDCDRAVRPDGQRHCISVACRYFRCRNGPSGEQRCQQSHRLKRDE